MDLYTAGLADGSISRADFLEQCSPMNRQYREQKELYMAALAEQHAELPHLWIELNALRQEEAKIPEDYHPRMAEVDDRLADMVEDGFDENMAYHINRWSRANDRHYNQAMEWIRENRIEYHEWRRLKEERSALMNAGIDYLQAESDRKKKIEYLKARIVAYERI